MLRTEGERHAIIFMMESLEGYMRKQARFIFAAKCLSSPPGEKSDQQSFRPHPDWSSYIIYTNICSSQLPAARLPLHRAQIIKLIRTEALNIFFLNQLFHFKRIIFAINHRHLYLALHWSFNMIRLSHYQYPAISISHYRSSALFVQVSYQFQHNLSFISVWHAITDHSEPYK